MSENPSPDMSAQRRMMVDGQIRTFGVTDSDVIERFLLVLREAFVEPAMAQLAYSDAVLRLSGDPRRTLLAPMVLARMIQGARLKAGARVLDIGGGLGYSAAIVAGLASQVVAVETTQARVEAIAAACLALGLANVAAVTGTLAAGYAQKGPYDLILVNGAVETEPTALLAQLADGGCLIVIANLPGQGHGQVLCYEASNGMTGQRALFDATAPVLEGFRAEPVFAF